MNSNPTNPRSGSTSPMPQERDPNRVTKGYAPSAVPVPVHRQVVMELEEARHQIQRLISDNQTLQYQNQELKTEIDRVVKAIRRLQGVAEGYPTSEVPTIAPVGSSWEEVPPLHPTNASDYDSAVPLLPRDTRPTHYAEEIPDPGVYAEMAEMRTTVQRSDLGGWWMLLTIVLIVVTAFGTGFLIVRPFLSNPAATPEQGN